VALQLGSAKALDDITLEDVIANPIWLWTWETGDENTLDPLEQDDAWQRPVLGTRDVTAEMSEPIITFRVSGINVVGSGSYRPREDRLFGMAVWRDGRWTLLKDSALAVPLSLIAVPTINGVADAEFVCVDLKQDEASRVR